MQNNLSLAPQELSWFMSPFNLSSVKPVAKALYASQACIILFLISRNEMSPLSSKLAKQWSWQLLLHFKAEENMEAKSKVLFLKKLHSSCAKRQSKDGFSATGFTVLLGWIIIHIWKEWLVLGGWNSFFKRSNKLGYVIWRHLLCLLIWTDHLCQPLLFNTAILDLWESGCSFHLKKQCKMGCGICHCEIPTLGTGSFKYILIFAYHAVFSEWWFKWMGY